MLSDVAASELLDDCRLNGSETEPCRSDVELLNEYRSVKKETDDEIIARLYRHVPLPKYTDGSAVANRMDATGASRLATARQAEKPRIIEKEAIMNGYCAPLQHQLLAGKGDFYYSSNRLISSIEATDRNTRNSVGSVVRTCMESFRKQIADEIKVETLAYRAKQRLQGIRHAPLGAFLPSQAKVISMATGRPSAVQAAASVMTNTSTRHSIKSAFQVVVPQADSNSVFHGVSKLRRRIAVDPNTGRATETTLSIDDDTDEEGEVPARHYESNEVGGLFRGVVDSVATTPYLKQTQHLRVVGSLQDTAVQLDGYEQYFSEENSMKRMDTMVEEMVVAVYDRLLQQDILTGASNVFRVEQAEEQMDIFRRQLESREALAAEQRSELIKALGNAQESVRQLTGKYDEVRSAFKDLQRNVGGDQRTNQPSITRSKSIFHIEKDNEDGGKSLRPSKSRASMVPRSRTATRLSAGLLEDSPSMNSTVDADMSPLVDAIHSSTLPKSRASTVQFPGAGSPVESVSSGVYKPAAGDQDCDNNVPSNSSVSPPSRVPDGAIVSNATAPRMHWTFDGMFIPAIVLLPQTSIEQLDAKHEEEWNARKAAEESDRNRNRKQSEAERHLKVLQASVSQHQTVATQRARQVHEEQLANVKTHYEGIIRDLHTRLDNLEKDHVRALEKQALKHLRDLTKQQQRSADRQSRWKMQLSRSIEEKCMEICDRDAQYDVCIEDLLRQHDMVREAHDVEIMQIHNSHALALEAQGKQYRQLQARYNAAKSLDTTLNVKPVVSRRSSAVSPVPSGLSDVVQVELPSDTDSNASSKVGMVPNEEDIVFTPSKNRRRKNSSSSGNVKPTMSRGRSVSTLPRRQSVLKRTTSVIPMSIREVNTPTTPSLQFTSLYESRSTQTDILQVDECTKLTTSSDTKEPELKAIQPETPSSDIQARGGIHTTSSIFYNSNMVSGSNSAQIVDTVLHPMWHDMCNNVLSMRVDLLQLAGQSPVQTLGISSNRRQSDVPLAKESTGGQLYAAKSQAFFLLSDDGSDLEGTPDLGLGETEGGQNVNSIGSVTVPQRPVTARVRKSVTSAPFFPTRPLSAKARSVGYIPPAAPSPRGSTALRASSTASFNFAHHASRAEQRRQEYLAEQRMRWEKVLWKSPEGEQ